MVFMKSMVNLAWGGRFTMKPMDSDSTSRTTPLLSGWNFPLPGVHRTLCALPDAQKERREVFTSRLLINCGLEPPSPVI